MTTDESTNPLRIAVLAGSDSAEREVSLRSGKAVAKALTTAGHTVRSIDPADQPLDEIPWSEFDVCFLALHGGAGEDGTIQAELERLKVPYTGSDPTACQLAMSKSASKQRFVACGVPTLPSELFAPGTAETEVLDRVRPLRFPVIVKPDTQGSSIGLSVAHDATELLSALQEAAHLGHCLVEPLVVGREFTVAVLDDLALPLIEIVTPEPVFSYEAKYSSSLTEYCFDIDLPEEQQQEIREAGLQATLALGTCGLVRVDIMVDADGKLWVLEVNTIPGMTPRSLAPQAALRTGLDMPKLCDLLARRALRKARGI